MIKILLLFFFSSCFAFTDREKRAWVNHNDRCTAFIVDPKGSADGATMTTHTNDCYNCDFRLARVPAQDWPEGSMKAIYEYRIAYPRYVGYDRGQVYWPQHTEGSYPWNITKPIGYIPQVPHTYAYLEGTYGLLNEYQVGMGESTCSAKIWSAPVSAGGGALMDISALSRLAMERCQTARCAVKTMGGLAEQYGFYGSAWTGDEAERFLEAGEAMTVSDPTEAWVFHILPDPTGKSAVWAAQRLQEGHFAIVANEFVIKEMDLDDPEYYLASKNILDVAKEKGFWDPSSGQPFNFKGAYMKGHPFKRYCQRRHWRGLSTAAPSLNLDGETDQMELPFSVKVDKPLTKEDFFRLLRDHYEGTPYDMTQGLSSGPYGNPNRYDMGTGSGTPIEVVYKGSFERAISIFRAQYSYVTVSRASLPNEIGAVMWFGHYAPHATVFVPFYVGSELPKAFQVGSLYQLNRQSSFWAFCLIGNWLEKYYKFIIVDIQAYQKLAETASSQAQEKFESIALALYNQNNIGATKAVLQEWSAPYAAEVVDKAWDFLDYLIVRYHDGYKFENLEVEFLNPTKLFYPFWWLEQVGYFNPNGSHVPAYMHDDPASMLPSTPVAPTPPPPYHEEHNHPSSPTNAPTPSHTAPTTLAAIPQAIPQSESAAFGFFTIALTAVVCLVVGVHLGSKYGHAFGYQAINEKYDD